MKKLEVDIETKYEGGKPINQYHCWSCNQRGKSIFSLLLNIKAPDYLIDELKNILKYTVEKKEVKEREKFNGLLPHEYRSLLNVTKSEIEARHALKYLRKRKITQDDIYRFCLGFCSSGEFFNRIIIPFYDENGDVNYFTARTIDEENTMRYAMPEYSRDIVPSDIFINWSEPIVLVEGGFDMMAVRRNVIPLLSKQIGDQLLMKIISSETKKIYVALDEDALKEAISHCEIMMSYGKRVFLLELGDKDPSKLGFENFTNLIQHAKELNSSTLLKLKINTKL